MNIVFDAYPTDPPIAFQYLGIDVMFEFRRVDERFDDKSAEINLFGRIVNDHIEKQESGWSDLPPVLL